MAIRTVKDIMSWKNGDRNVSKEDSHPSILIFSTFQGFKLSSTYKSTLGSFFFPSWYLISVIFPNWWKQFFRFWLLTIGSVRQARPIAPWRHYRIGWHIVLTGALDGTLVPPCNHFYHQVSRLFDGISRTCSSINAASHTGACVIFSETMTLVRNAGTLRMPHYVWWSRLVVKGARHDRNWWS